MCSRRSTKPRGVRASTCGTDTEGMRRTSSRLGRVISASRGRRAVSLAARLGVCVALGTQHREGFEQATACANMRGISELPSRSMYCPASRCVQSDTLTKPNSSVVYEQQVKRRDCSSVSSVLKGDGLRLGRRGGTAGSSRWSTWRRHCSNRRRQQYGSYRRTNANSCWNRGQSHRNGTQMCKQRP